jgi:hypothetical protein
MVDPGAAVTAVVAGQPSTTPAAGLRRSTVDGQRPVPYTPVVLVIVTALVAGAAALALPRGHRRRFRAGIVVPRTDPERAEPAPPVELFADRIGTGTKH